MEFIYAERLEQMRETVRVTIFTALFVLCGIFTSSMGRAEDDNLTAARNIFDGPQFGLMIVLGIETLCPHLKQHLQSEDPNQRIVLMTDENATAFHSEACVGRCDLVHANTILSRCQRDTKIKRCKFYGALYKGRFYNLTFNPLGSDLHILCSVR